MSKTPDQGQVEAHTHGENPGDAPVSPLPGADPAILLGGSPDEQAHDVLELVAELTLSRRKGPGRPLASPNRKNGDLIKLLQARGHRDPWVTLSLIQSADFGALCAMVGATKAKEKIAVLGIMRGAASDIMPFNHSKMPQQLELPVGDKRPLMVIGELNVGIVADVEGFMSAGMPPMKTVDNQ